MPHTSASAPAPAAQEAVGSYSPPPPPQLKPLPTTADDHQINNAPATLISRPPHPKQGTVVHLPMPPAPGLQEQPSAQGLTVASIAVSSNCLRSAAGASTTSSSQPKESAVLTSPVDTPPVGTADAAAKVAPLIETGAGAGGCATAAPCVLAGVATRDSVSNYQVLPLHGCVSCQSCEQPGKAVLPLHGCLLHGERTGNHADGRGICAGAFRQESGLYTDPSQPLGRCLPQMQRIAEGAGSGLRDAQGAVMAPCIVMEQGEALDVWIQKSGDKIDMFTGLQARPLSVCRACGAAPPVLHTFGGSRVLHTCNLL